MTTSFIQVLLCLLTGIGVIILLTAKYKVHAFFALLIACFLVCLGVQLPFVTMLNHIKEGFGHTMQLPGLIIVLGTTLGVLLEHAGCTRVMAGFILKKVGENRAPLEVCSVATIWMGLITLMTVYILSLFLL